MNPIEKYKQNKQTALNEELAYVCRNGYNITTLQSKLVRGADIHCTTADGKNMLDIAVNAKTIKFFLDKGLTFSNQEDLDAALSICIQNADTTAALINMGADVNNQYAIGRNTPLHCAIRSDKVDVVHLLLQHGAQPDIKNNDDETPIELSRRLYSKNKSHFQQKILDAFHIVTGRAEIIVIADAEKISYIHEEPELGQHITETFNFKSGLYREVIYCDKTTTQSSAVLAFNALESTRHLADAEAEFVARGGVPEYSLKKHLDKL